MAENVPDEMPELPDEQELDAEEMERISHQDDGIHITLCEPVTFKPSKMDDERTITELVLPKKVKGKHLKAMDKAQGEMGKTCALLAKLSGITESAFDEIDSRDIVLALEAIRPFLPRRRGTGNG